MATNLGANVAAQAGHSSGLPGLSAMLGTASLISDIVQRAKYNRTFLQALSWRVSECVVALAEGVDQVGVASDEWLTVFQDFQRNLDSIYIFLQKQQRTSYVVHLLHQDKEREELLGMQDNLNTSYQVLMLQARIITIRSIEDVNNRLATFPLAAQIADYGLEDPPARSGADIPPCPQIHFGRNAQLHSVIDPVIQSVPPARLIILGPGGVGKTSLVLAVLHSTSVERKYGVRRFFVSCDAASKERDILSIVTGELGLHAETKQVLQKTLIQMLNRAPTILVFDNFESAWDDTSVRKDAEALLALLDSLQNLTIILTMRGNERPIGLSWTRPFIQPLGPLDDEAAIQTFMTIGDIHNSSAEPHVRKLLGFIDNLPLAVVLLARMAQDESLESLAQRWITERTTMLARSGEPNRLSNLDFSISVSLESPRLKAVGDAAQMLSLLSLLPDGSIETDVPLFTCHLEQNLRCITILVQNALVFRTTSTPPRIRVLAPIREYMMRHFPPTESVAQPLFDYYYSLTTSLLGMYIHKKPEIISSLMPELANLDAVLGFALDHVTDRRPVIDAIVRMSEVLKRTAIFSYSILLLRATDIARADKYEAGLADCLRWSVDGAQGQPDRLKAEERLVEAIEIYRRVGNEVGELACNLSLANATGNTEPEKTQQLVISILPRIEALGDATMLARAFIILSHTSAGLSEARPWLDRALSAVLKIPAPGDPRAEARVRVFYADLAFRAGELPRALDLMQDALAATERASEFTLKLQATRNIGSILRTRGYARKAVPYLEEVTKAYATQGNGMLETWSWTILCNAQFELGELELANQSVARARSVVAAVQRWPWGELETHLCQSRIAIREEDWNLADALTTRAQAIAHEKSWRDDEGRALLARANYYEARGRHEEALSTLTLASVLFLKTPYCLVDLLKSLVSLARIWVKLGRHAESIIIVDAIMPALYRAGLERAITEAFLTLADCATPSGRRKLAIRAYKRAQAIQDNQLESQAAAVLEQTV